MTPLEYRQTRAAIRDGSSLALDRLDALYACLSRGESGHALTAARDLALVADDLTALLERIVRSAAREATLTERYAHGVK